MVFVYYHLHNQYSFNQQIKNQTQQGQVNLFKIPNPKYSRNYEHLLFQYPNRPKMFSQKSFNNISSQKKLDYTSLSDTELPRVLVLFSEELYFHHIQQGYVESQIIAFFESMRLVRKFSKDTPLWIECNTYSKSDYEKFYRDISTTLNKNYQGIICIYHETQITTQESACRVAGLDCCHFLFLKDRQREKRYTGSRNSSI